MQNNASLTLAGNNSGAFTSAVTLPDGATVYHLIENRDLQDLMKIGNPKALLFAIGCFGYAMGQLQFILNLIQKFVDAKEAEKALQISISAADLILFAIVILAFVLASIFGVMAFFSRSESAKVLERIQKRPTVTLNLQSR